MDPKNRCPTSLKKKRYDEPVRERFSFSENTTNCIRYENGLTGITWMGKN